MVVAEGKSDQSAWQWHDITMVITTKEVGKEEAKKLMCAAHQNHANFAFISKCTLSYLSDNVTNDTMPLFFLLIKRFLI